MYQQKCAEEIVALMKHSYEAQFFCCSHIRLSVYFLNETYTLAVKYLLTLLKFEHSRSLNICPGRLTFLVCKTKPALTQVF